MLFIQALNRKFNYLNFLSLCIKIFYSMSFHTWPVVTFKRIIKWILYKLAPLSSFHILILICFDHQTYLYFNPRSVKKWLKCVFLKVLVSYIWQWLYIQRTYITVTGISIKDLEFRELKTHYYIEIKLFLFQYLFIITSCFFLSSYQEQI